MITHFLSNYPQLQNAGLSIDWKRKDDAKGYAVGSISIGNASVPVIINDYILSPMDVLMFDGKAYPLTSETLNMYLSSPEAFKGLDPKTTGQNLSIFGLTDNSMFTNYGTGNTREGVSFSERPAIKVASFIDYVSNVKQEDVDNILTKVASDSSLEEGFVLNNTNSVIEKLASKDSVNEESFAENLLRGLDVDRNLVYQDDLGNYFLKQANSNVDYTWDTPVSSIEAHKIQEKYAEEEPIEKVASTKVANSYEMLDGSDVFYINDEFKYAKFNNNEIPVSETTKIAGVTPNKGDLGVWKIGNKVSDVIEIVGFDKIAESKDVNSYNITGKQATLYISDEKTHEIDDSSVEKTAKAFEIEGDSPNLGDFGTFVIGDTAENPFEITAIQKVAGEGNYEIIGYSGLQKIAYYPIKMHKDELISHETQKNAYYVPGNAKFIKLSAETKHDHLKKEITKTASRSPLAIKVINNRQTEVYYPIKEDAEELTTHISEKNAYYLPKNAEFIKLEGVLEVNTDESYEKVAHSCGRDTAGLYYFEGPEFRKYAETHEIRNLNKTDAQWALIHCGGSKNDVEKVAQLKPREVIAVRTPLKSPSQLPKIEEAVKTAYDASKVDINKLKCDLIKEASVLQDKSTVDAVLSLNLLNKENVMDYIQLAPNLEKTASDLAKTLITVRMGLSHIPEQAVKTAMVSLAGVAHTLRQLESVITDTK